MKNHYIVLAVFFLFSLFLTTHSAVRAQSSCGLATSNPYKSSSSNAVWYVSDDCAKRPVKDPNVYFSHFGSWDNVQVVSDTALANIPNHELGFLPWGTRRTFANGSILKTVDDPRVYLVISDVKYPIGSESAFSGLGFTFSQVEDVVSDVLSPLTTGAQIDDLYDYPAGLVFGYRGDTTLYIMERDNASGKFARRHIQSFADVERDYRTDRLPSIAPESVVKSSSRGAVTSGTSLSNVGSVTSVTFSDEVATSPTTPLESTQPVCGNAVRESGEVCDDGSDNGRPGYCNIACSGNVAVAVVPAPPTTPTTPSTNSCGNGTVETNEGCDTGITYRNISCQHDCSGFVPYANTPESQYCGNGELDPYEACDHTWSPSGSCTNQCTTVNGIVGNGGLAPMPQCGDGNVDSGEVCDHGASNGNPGQCNTTCTGTIPTNQTPYTPATIDLATRDMPNSCDVSGYGLTGATYYYCDCGAGADADCQAGSGSAPSTNPAAPATGMANAMAQFNSMPAGSTVALCRGGSFDISGATRAYNTSCTNASRCQLTDYTPAWVSGDEARPIVNSNENGLSFADGGDSDGDGGYVVSNIHLKQSAGNAASFGIFTFNEVDDLLACNMVFDSFGIGMHVAGRNALSTGDGVSTNIDVTYSEFIDNENQGYLGTCTNCDIEYNYFDNNGWFPERQSAASPGVFSHSIYLSGGSESEPADNVSVQYNEIYNSVHYQNNSCQGAVIVTHGYQTNFNISNNIIKETPGTAYNACWGIAPSVGGYNSLEGFFNFTITNNTIEYVGNQAIFQDDCTNCTINNNSIRMNTSYPG